MGAPKGFTAGNVLSPTQVKEIIEADGMPNQAALIVELGYEPKSASSIGRWKNGPQKIPDDTARKLLGLYKKYTSKTYDAGIADADPTPAVAQPFKVDPEFAALMAPYTDDEEKQRVFTMLDRDGILDKLVVWNDPSDPDTPILVDGHTRWEWWRSRRKKGYPLSEQLEGYETRQQVLDWAVELQLARRNLDQDQKRQLIARFLKQTPETSNRQVAAMAGVDHKTVAPVRQCLETSGEIPQLEKTIGKDGNKRTVRPQPKVDTTEPPVEPVVKPVAEEVVETVIDVDALAAAETVHNVEPDELAILRARVQELEAENAIFRQTVAELELELENATALVA